MIDPATILDAYDTLEAEAQRHCPGGVLFDQERATIRKRVAKKLDVDPQDVLVALRHRHQAVEVARG